MREIDSTIADAQTGRKMACSVSERASKRRVYSPFDSDDISIANRSNGPKWADFGGSRCPQALSGIATNEKNQVFWENRVFGVDNGLELSIMNIVGSFFDNWKAPDGEFEVTSSVKSKTTRTRGTRLHRKVLSQHFRRLPVCETYSGDTALEQEPSAPSPTVPYRVSPVIKLGTAREPDLRFGLRVIPILHRRPDMSESYKRGYYDRFELIGYDPDDWDEAEYDRGWEAARSHQYGNPTEVVA